MNPLWSYPLEAVYLRTRVKQIPHSSESEERLNKCYVEVQAMGYVNGSAVVETVTGGGGKEHCRSGEKHEQVPEE